MPGQTRKRTAAQRKAKEEEVPAEDKVIQDEQEQETEIAALKAKNAVDTQKARNTMDIGIIIAMLVHGLAVPKYVQLGALLPIITAGIQLSLLPLSLSPQWATESLQPVLEKHHEKVVLAHLVILIIALHRLLQTTSWKILDIVVWGLPFIVSASVELQRRSERGVEKQLKEWKKKRYHVKGA